MTKFFQFFDITMLFVCVPTFDFQTNWPIFMEFGMNYVTGGHPKPHTFAFENGGNLFLLKTGNHLQHYMAPQPRSPLP